jgi:hypothetical protein
MSMGARTNVDFWVVRGGEGGASSACAGIAYRVVGPGEAGEALIDSLVEAGSREGLRYAAEVACAVISRGKLVESSVPVAEPARRGQPGWESTAKECVVELCRDRKVRFAATDQLLRFPRAEIGLWDAPHRALLWAHTPRCYVLVHV